MSADRTVTVGEYGHSKVRCDGSQDGRRCPQTVTGKFRQGIKGARSTARKQGWSVDVRTYWGLRDYCPKHAEVERQPMEFVQ